MCRSRRELSNEYLLAKIGVDTAVNEPLQVCPLSAYRSPRLLAAALVRVGKAAVGHAVAAQQFEFPPGADLIWINWLLTYLNDADAVHVLRCAAAAVAGDGVICVKDNVGKTSVDRRGDHGRSRPRQEYADLFAAAGLAVRATRAQKPWAKR